MKKIISVKQYQLPVTLVKDGEGFVANCASWPDCYAQGDSVDEALSEIYAVTASLIELYSEEGMAILFWRKELC